MLIPRRYSHFVYGTIQSGLTTGVATAVAASSYEYEAMFLQRWAAAWFTSWVVMMPLVLFVAPLIQRFTAFLTYDRSPNGRGYPRD